MDSIRVQGGIALQGKVKIQGSKNAALPIMAASLLTSEPVLLQNCPKITDVRRMIAILKSLGCRVRWEKDALRICSGELLGGELPEEAVSEMRSSVFMLGALLARRKEARLQQPGGCVIGQRPIDIHVKSLERMGAEFKQQEEGLYAHAANGLHGEEIELRLPSVGATENLVMAAVLATGTTRIRGAAREPEVSALCGFLTACGARIEGIGTGVLTIEGVDSLHGTVFRIPADRIVAGTYLLAGFAAGGNLFLEEAPVREMDAVLRTAERMGAGVHIQENGIYAQVPRRAGTLPFLRTDVYPGFPTDLQSVVLAVRCTGEGNCVIRENIFENRFRVVQALRCMGGDIRQLDERTVRVCGCERLSGADVQAYELRGGAAIVTAALGAKGETVISGRRFIDRGYENICRDLRELGARIVSD